jgi:alpha-tubulin suppressor-like RCC1 family protein
LQRSSGIFFESYSLKLAACGWKHKWALLPAGLTWAFGRSQVAARTRSIESVVIDPYSVDTYN